MCSSSTSRLSPVLNAFRHHRGRHTPFEATVLQFFIVLNAFRHHRGRHASPPARSCRRPRCAQRLSASQRSARGERSARSSNPACAQRLSASQRSARKCPGDRRYECIVLNAFRHHRGRHGRLRGGVRPTRKCSTPFGITEVGTRIHLHRNVISTHVLNAFRHHRGRHSRRGRCETLRGACSTPFGITEVGTRPGRRGPSSHRCAQRLSASQRSAPISSRSRGATSFSAQRLSASQRSARDDRS